MIKTEELYPFEIYAVIGNVEGIEPGVYRYIPQEHKIVRTIDEDVRDELCAVALCRLDIITNSATYIAL
ncbi:MAG: hypothetical protein LBH91_07690 [Prevotellaceae bacterium]|nr:hypothetical protein [Prevotellaceae bacterium]